MIEEQGSKRQDIDLHISCACGVYGDEGHVPPSSQDYSSFNNYRKPQDLFCNVVVLQN